jgi:hypothetical protein
VHKFPFLEFFPSCAKGPVKCEAASDRFARNGRISSNHSEQGGRVAHELRTQQAPVRQADVKCANRWQKVKESKANERGFNKYPAAERFAA